MTDMIFNYITLLATKVEKILILIGIVVHLHLVKDKSDITSVSSYNPQTSHFQYYRVCLKKKRNEG